ncbi:hypothetical protein BGZ73_004843 [Actinomortierella ambigua]|nr:hypothetical protein BGZ73_004843 [Actinomortierella ambigua]
MPSLTFLTKVLKVAMAVALVSTGSSQSCAATSTFGPTITPPNPYTGKTGLATMHGDAASSDTTPYPGPGSATITSTRRALQSACPALLGTSDSFVFGLCTTIFGQTPTVHLFSPQEAEDLAELKIVKGNILGGVYAYVDNLDRLVLTNGNNELLRVAKSYNAATNKYSLQIVDTLPLSPAIPSSDSVVGLTPDWQGNVWFATAAGVAGYADPVTRAVVVTPLRASPTSSAEIVANSISTSPAGTLITTTFATYLLTRDPTTGSIQTVWRQAYDRGPARKPGQLSWGSGSTPTFFGPATGYEYTTIVDNAHPLVNLLVYRIADGSEICKVPLFETHNSGSENSPIGSGRSVFIASTYGYPYPKLPDGAGPSQPKSAPFVGGIERVDVNEDDTTGCTVRWINNNIRSSAVPKLSLSEGQLYTIVRHGLLSQTTTSTGLLDKYYYATIDAETGAITTQQHIGTGALFDTLQMAGLTLDNTFFQGTITGVVRIKRA